MTNKRKKQKLLNSIVKWFGAVGGIGALLTFLSMVYSFGEKFGEDIKNIEIATMQRDFGLKEVEYKHKIFQLQMKCDSLQQKIKSYER